MTIFTSFFHMEKYILVTKTYYIKISNNINFIKLVPIKTLCSQILGSCSCFYLMKRECCFYQNIWHTKTFLWTLMSELCQKELPQIAYVRITCMVSQSPLIIPLYAHSPPLLPPPFPTQSHTDYHYCVDNDIVYNT